jgi:hypothetical protein
MGRHGGRPSLRVLLGWTFRAIAVRFSLKYHIHRKYQLPRINMHALELICGAIRAANNTDI